MGQPQSGKEDDGIRLRKPCAEDGAGVWELIAACPPLDQNSMYCNLLQCTHFAETCVLAELEGGVVGWISGHRPPPKPDVVFVWQVAVGEAARGRGLGKRMLLELVRRSAEVPARRLQTTITEDNEASWRLFRSFARAVDAPLEHAPWLEREAHFAGHHDTEHLLTIGPFAAAPDR